MRPSSLVLALASCAVAACADPTPAASDDLGGGGPPDLGASDGDTPTPDRDASVCATVSSIGTLAKKPVDIIFVIDNSGSMTDEIQAVQDNLNDSFARIIEASGLDYRIILISKFGVATVDQSICIAAPLSGDSCVPPLPRSPTDGARFFHFSTEIGSRNSFDVILDNFDSWTRWLRPTSAKIFVEITDDNDETMPWTAFDAALLQRAPALFGTESNRNYIFHAITGVAAKANPAEAYQPSEPIVAEADRCPSSENSGVSYQNLAKLTGGLRFPICDPSKFSTVFQVIAKGVVTGAQVACELDVPAVPAPAVIDLAAVRLEYQPSTGGPAQTFTQVADASSCVPGGFYVASGGARIVICPDSCTSVQADPNATVRVWFDCTYMIP